jgi:hypothetical protein
MPIINFSSHFAVSASPRHHSIRALKQGHSEGFGQDEDRGLREPACRQAGTKGHRGKIRIFGKEQELEQEQSLWFFLSSAHSLLFLHT